MSEQTAWKTFTSWFWHLPIRIAYRIVWLCAKFDLGAGNDIYKAMWDANLSLPLLNKETSK